MTQAGGNVATPYLGSLPLSVLVADGESVIELRLNGSEGSVVELGFHIAVSGGKLERKRHRLVAYGVYVLIHMCSHVQD